MSEKSNLYVSKVIGNQLGHNPELEATSFKNTVNATDNLFEDLGADMNDLKEIAIQIDNDLESNFYSEIVEAETVSDIRKIVAAAQISDDKLDSLLAVSEPKKEGKKEEAAAPATVPASVQA